MHLGNLNEREINDTPGRIVKKMTKFNTHSGKKIERVSSGKREE